MTRPSLHAKTGGAPGKSTHPDATGSPHDNDLTACFQMMQQLILVQHFMCPQRSTLTCAGCEYSDCWVCRFIDRLGAIDFGADDIIHLRMFLTTCCFMVFTGNTHRPDTVLAPHNFRLYFLIQNPLHGALGSMKYFCEHLNFPGDSFPKICGKFKEFTAQLDTTFRVVAERQVGDMLVGKEVNMDFIVYRSTFAADKLMNVYKADMDGIDVKLILRTTLRALHDCLCLARTPSNSSDEFLTGALPPSMSFITQVPTTNALATTDRDVQNLTKLSTFLAYYFARCWDPVAGVRHCAWLMITRHLMRVIEMLPKKYRLRMSVIPWDNECLQLTQILWDHHDEACASRRTAALMKEIDASDDADLDATAETWDLHPDQRCVAAPGVCQ